MRWLQKFFITIQNIASKPSRFFSRPLRLASRHAGLRLARAHRAR